MNSPPSQLPSAQDIRARAASWLIERRDGTEWDSAKQEELDAWLDQSPAHRIAYLRLDATWARADRLAILRSTSTRRGTFGKLIQRCAAALIILALFGLGSTFLVSKPQIQTYTTGIGGNKTIELSDGSRIELNTNTVVRLSLSENARTVWLDRGEAYFEVRHDQSRPFSVNAGRGRIVDIGTKFTVRREGTRLDVTLVDGKARFEPLAGAEKGRVINLVPGDQVIASVDSLSTLHVAPKTLRDSLSWRNGILTFDNITLAEVASTFNRYNRQKLVIAGEDVARLTVVGTFRTDGTQRFARVARDILGLQITHHGDEIIISR